MIQSRIILAEDHAIVRAGIRALLKRIEGVDVVGEASNGSETLELARAQKPDIVMMDISMPAPNGLETTAQLKKELPDIRVIILSMHADDEYVSQALLAGASGYLLKRSATIELELAIRGVMQGQRYLSPPISKQAVEEHMQRSEWQQSPLEMLTPRQLQILRLVAEGISTKEIARQLAVSTKTVEAHRTQLMDRLEIRDISGLVLFAIRHGLIPADK